MKLIVAGLAGFVVAAILHNVFYAVFGVEEPVFFLLAVIVGPMTFLIGVVGVAFKAFRVRRRG